MVFFLLEKSSLHKIEKNHLINIHQYSNKNISSSLNKLSLVSLLFFPILLLQFQRQL